MRDLEKMQQDGYSSDDEFEDEEDAVNFHEEMEGASVSAQLLEQEMTEAEARPTPASTVTRLPCAAHKVQITRVEIDDDRFESAWENGNFFMDFKQDTVY